MPQEHEQSPQSHAGRAWPLYGAAFSTALSLGMVWTAMPFVLVAMGGTKAHVGYAPAASSFAYMAALLLTGSMLGHLDVRLATRLAMIVATMSILLMVTAVAGALFAGLMPPIVWVWLTIVAGGFVGAAMALHWPFLMSWVSGTYEGVALNRRFGRYNGSWSSGALVGPLIGARLVEIAPIWPVVAAATAMATSLILLGFARNSRDGARTPRESQTPSGPVLDAGLLADFRWLSRIGMFCGWACFAIARSQFALLFTSLGYSESRFGVFLMLVAGCNLLALTACGRWPFWHFRAGMLIGAQGMFLLSMLMLLYGSSLPVFFLAAIILGLAFGFAYSSHLYYGTSTSRNRSVRMAIHEIVISVGVGVGSGAGGYLAENVGLYAPYWFAVGLVAFGMFIQTTLHTVARAKAAIRGRPHEAAEQAG